MADAEILPLLEGDPEGINERQNRFGELMGECSRHDLLRFLLRDFEFTELDVGYAVCPAVQSIRHNTL